MTIAEMIDPVILLETALLVAQEPLSEKALSQLFEPTLSQEQVKVYLEALQQQWAARGIVLYRLSSGWRFHTRVELMPYLARLNPERSPRYSRAVMETLAIIAYKQPVTRSDIEAIRGVSVSTNVIQTLSERGWIEIVGRKEIPGRPNLYATTTQYLNDVGLQSLEQLPPLTELDSLVISTSDNK